MRILSSSRWYYNYALCILNKIKDDRDEYKKVVNKKGGIAYDKFRNYIRNWDYKEVSPIVVNNITLINGDDIIPDPLLVIKRQSNQKGGYPQPSFLGNKTHNRVIRGAFKNLAANVNSALANKKAGNIHDFNIKYKKNLNVAQIEDMSLNSLFKKIIGYHTKGKIKILLKDELERRESLSLLKTKQNKIKNSIKKAIKEGKKDEITLYPIDTKIDKTTYNQGYTLSYDSRDKKYYLLLPTNVDGIKREGKDTISLDTGVRTFQTGYSPQGHVLEIGKKACDRISYLLKRADKLDTSYKFTSVSKYRKRRLLTYKKISNLIDELHWKSISYLTSNYSLIYLPDFRIKGMVKGKRLSRMVKRLLYMFSYYKFKERLLWKAGLAGVEVKVVDESYTSKTCSNCGYLHSGLGSNKIFECPNCSIVMDRDINAARNIYIKNH